MTTKYLSFDLLLLALALLLLVRVKFVGIKGWHDDFVRLPVSKGLQGFCAILVVLHHVSQSLMEQASPLTFLADIGVCFVGIFFFFSGYGLLKSLNTKPDYLHHFLRKRLPVILVPFYITIVVFLIVSKMLGASYETTEFISYLTGWKLINSHMWYIVEIFLLYIIFFVIFRLIKNRGVALTMMSILVVLLTVGSLLLGHGDYWFQGEWWFNTSFLFVIGMLTNSAALAYSFHL